jgi:23S rRNA (uracil1939-C5)-methyltransferase
MSLKNNRGNKVEMKIKKGEELTLHIESMAFEGKAIARIEGLVVFVHNAVPGDTVRARIIKVKQQYLEARTLEVVVPSAMRVQPRCRYFGVCGGCKMQDVRYENQLEFKHRYVIDAFERIGRLDGIKIPAPIGADSIFFYRNKMEFSFSDQRWLTAEEIRTGEEFARDFALGLHVTGRYDKVIDIEECYLQSETSNRILTAIRAFAMNNRLAPYSASGHRGYLRFLVVRQSRATGEIMVNLVTHSNRPDIVKPMIEYVCGEVPEVTTIVNTINTKKAQIAVGDEEVIYVGDGTITDTIGTSKFRISANSFFQTNTAQAERLFSIARDFGELQRDDIALDLYSGTGTIAIYLSDSVGKVYGVESVTSAVEDARANAVLNGIANVEFVPGDVPERLRDRTSWLKEEPTIGILDPPRSGLHPKAVVEIITLRLPRIVYVSCNPATQARDLAAFVESGYRIDRVQPVDMFPHTYHIENVVRLTLAQGYG